MQGSSDETLFERRDALRTICVGTAGLAVTGTSAGRNQETLPEPSVRFEDQQSDGTTVVVRRAATDVDAFVVIKNADGEFIVWDPSDRIDLAAGETVGDVTVKLEEPLSASQKLTAVLWESNGQPLDQETALISLDGEPPERTDGFDPLFVEADPDAGFEYPYYLYAPDTFPDDPRPILVEPNNTGTSTDEFETHVERAERTIESGTGRTIADDLFAPFLVPVFPRPRRNPVDWTHYVHQLDATTMSIDDGPLERVDLQLLEMVSDARDRLDERGYPVADGIMLNGFSASGNFVDRFTVLHPDRVLSVTAGGLNGMALLPLDAANGHTLNYHVGVANVESLTGEPVDLAALDEVNQFLYMGSEDDNDTIPYDDAWTDDELREIALEVYGDDMIAQRFSRSQEAYQKAGVSAQFRVYDGVGHTPRPAIDNLVEFHRRSMNDEDVSEFGDDLVTEPALESTTLPQDKTQSNRTSSDAGEGETQSNRTSVDDRTETEPEADESGDGETVPGFGMMSALASVGGIGYLLKRRSSEEDP